MEIPSVTVSQRALKEALTMSINDFIRTEKAKTGLEYQQNSFYIRGQISILASLIKMPWDPKKQSYYQYINNLVEQLELHGVPKGPLSFEAGDPIMIEDGELLGE